jgi:hypothetical protein
MLFCSSTHLPTTTDEQASEQERETKITEFLLPFHFPLVDVVAQKLIDLIKLGMRP